ncbi:chromosome segregation protein SMC [Macrococcoides canis]|uniref:chromosome segregation protein SMC n=1 Tax=Macrococcoides canis TaxID=1855823 RepID=UPI00105DA77E|nr:chromosome segregation protein SMC [Macrococcus canis]TDM34543.1 chromosome segregation protein SMC [Macrococcus canis]TDM37958.1 chromosome segregation protein SMC [Macrococcus canis]
MVYLQSVEATGFKSFADKTTVLFDEGVTAIVGPNGSGKSNITDAIKWVLGEQSAKSLRGAKMEDIIFSGAQNRNATNFAQVTLTINNLGRSLAVDSDKVLITRKLFRSGESEYFINHQKVRLKDITELFLDSGLGRDAFSIISQGKVDQVLNAKPSERRQLIEEAAGVLKYKKRKVETEQKLEDTMNNLSRVHDIIFDLKDRVEPLKIEASIAEEYIALSEEMKDADIQVTVHDIKERSAEYERLQREILNFNEQLTYKKDKSERISSKLDAHKSERNEQQKQLETHKTDLLHITERIERNIGLLNVNKERLSHQNANYEEKHQLQKTLADTLEHTKKELSSTDAKIQTIKQEKLSKKQKLSETEHDQSALADDIEAIIEETRSEYYEQFTIKTKLENDIQHMNSRIEQFNRKEEAQIDESTITQYEVLLSEQQSLNEQINRMEKTVDHKRLSYTQHQQHITKQKQLYFKESENLKQAERFISTLESKVNRLKMMQEEYQGYYQGVRLLLKNKEKLDGIHHTVLDSISVEPQYNDALDSALGGVLQHIIVEDAQSARKAIAFLKSKQAGRATFLPLNVIRPRNITNDILTGLTQFDGYIGTLNTLITADNQYKNIVDNIAGHIIIASTLAEANKIAKFASYRHKVVTLDGQVVNPGGSMTGGSKQKPTQALSSRNELQQLTKQLSEYETQTSQLREKVSQLNESISEAEFQLEQDKQNGIELRDELHQLKLTREEIHVKLERLQSKLEARSQYDKERDEISQLEKDKTVIMDNIQSIDIRLTELTEKIKLYQNNAQNKKTLLENMQQEIQSINKSISQLDADINYYQKVKQDLSDKIETTELELEHLSQLDHTINREKLEKEIVQLEKDIGEDKEKKSFLHDQIEKLQHNIGEYIEQETELELQNKELIRQINGIENGIGELKVQHSRLDVKLENYIEHLSFTYEMTYEAAEDYMFEHSLTVDDAEQLNELRSRVKLTKIAIDELGPVNMNAIEQYKALSERYEFLISQETDLLEAKDNLEMIIRDMDHTVAERFKATFEVISNAFEHIFKQLFGGGEGRLILTEEDYLTSGIDIYVQPPGKKRQHLSLLSGGERAMTAIVLLFAILNRKKAPFVILDEVEAALDEANVSRFAHYLTTLKKDTQFIVITHRKGTMEESDRLYGVTMQNSGISKLVSVNLKEIDDKKFKELTK